MDDNRGMTMIFAQLSYDLTTFIIFSDTMCGAYSINTYIHLTIHTLNHSYYTYITMEIEQTNSQYVMINTTCINETHDEILTSAKHYVRKLPECNLRTIF